MLFVYVFCICLSLLSYSVDVVEAAPPGRPKTTGVVGTCKHEVINFVAPGSAHLVNTTVVKHFFYNALALNALPVHLLRQVYFLGLFGFVFFVRFPFFFWEGLEGPLGAIGSIWEPFGEHSGLILVTFSG